MRIPFDLNNAERTASIVEKKIRK